MVKAAEKSSGTITLAIGDFADTGNNDAFSVLYKYCEDKIAQKAKYHLRYSGDAMVHPDDVANIIMLELAFGLKKESGWLVEAASNRTALVKIIAHMTFLRCCKILRYEKSRPALRASSISDDPETAYAVFVDYDTAAWEVDCKITLEEIETGLRKLNTGVNTEQLVRVFQGMQIGESDDELAAAIGMSRRTISRIKRIIREFAAQMLQMNQVDCHRRGKDQSACNAECSAV